MPRIFYVSEALFQQLSAATVHFCVRCDVAMLETEGVALDGDLLCSFECDGKQRFDFGNINLTVDVD